MTLLSPFCDSPKRELQSLRISPRRGSRNVSSSSPLSKVKTSPRLVGFGLKPLQITVSLSALSPVSSTSSLSLRIVSYVFRASRVVRLPFSHSSVARVMPQNVRAVSESIRKKSTLALFEPSQFVRQKSRTLLSNPGYGIPFPLSSHSASVNSPLPVNPRATLQAACGAVAWTGHKRDSASSSPMLPSNAYTRLLAGMS
jgi:hypothetical protein